MLRAILIDDERIALKAFKRLLDQYDNIEIVGEYTDVFEAIEKIKNDDINVVFLDIDMPKINGIEAAEKILSINSNIQIVFVTAYDNYALDAFEVDAIDYIMKPILKRRLDKTINKIIKNFPLDSQINSEKKENKILCFGNFEWINNSETVKWRTTKTKELIAYLIHNRGKFVYKDKIIENLWADKEMEKAVKLLHTSIYNIRKSLKAIGIEKGIIYSDEMYRLNIQNIDCDIYEFDDIIDGEVVIKTENIKELKKIVELYRGGYFEENDYLWAKDEQERLSQLYIDILKQISRFYIRQRQYNHAITYLKKILEKNFYIEEVHKMLLYIYTNIGDNTSFNEHYSKVIKIFSDELGIKLDFSIKQLNYELHIEEN